MRAIQITELSGPEALALVDVPEPEATTMLTPGSGVLVDVHAAGVSFPEVLQTRGEYQLKPPLPFTPGVEAAGDVVEVNTAEGVAVGDRVIVKMRHGAYCDEAVATPSQLVKLPSTFDYAEGCRLPRTRPARAPAPRNV